MQIKVEKIKPSGKLPVRAEEGSVGLDCFVDSIEVEDGALVYKLGIAVEPPEGFFTMLVPRSSITKKEWVFGNSVGIIDPSYRGELQVRLRPIGTVFLLNEEGIITSQHNKRQELPYQVGDRIAQLVVLPIVKVAVEEGPLTRTLRNTGGFGSTGKK